MRRINGNHSHLIATRGGRGRTLLTTNSSLVRRIAAALGLGVVEIEW